MMSREDHTRAMLALSIAHITSPAENRARTAKEPHAAMLEAMRGPDDLPPPDADDESTTRAGVLL